MAAKSFIKRGHRRASEWLATPAWAWTAAALLWVAGCSTGHYRKSADKEAYQAITAKAPGVPNMETKFTIEQTNQLSLGGLPVTGQAPEFLGPAGAVEVGARRVSLEEALKIAVRHSRSYQTSKEQLYLSALSLTLARHQFTPIYSAGGNGNLRGQQYYAPSQSFQPDPNNPTNLIPVLSDTLAEQSQVSTHGSVNVSWLIRASDA